MKQRDVKIGQVYLTKINPSAAWQEVVVVDQVQDFSSGRTKFRVRRNIPGAAVLPKSRAASALHERSQQLPASKSDAQERSHELPKQGLTDVRFEEAGDTYAIQYRLHPLDVGFSVTALDMPVDLGTEDVLCCSYPAADGERRVMAGPRAQVIARLRKLGFTIV